MLQTLLREGVSIRDLGTILEAIGDGRSSRAIRPRSPSTPARRSRRQIVTRLACANGAASLACAASIWSARANCGAATDIKPAASNPKITLCISVPLSANIHDPTVRAPRRGLNIA